jgi:hypothetical protein
LSSIAAPLTVGASHAIVKKQKKGMKTLNCLMLFPFMAKTSKMTKSTIYEVDSVLHKGL